MTTYEIETVNQEGKEDSIPLKATSDKTAIKEMRTWIKRHIAEQMQRGNQAQPLQVFLRFCRDTDGCTGYINPSGNASATGQAWPTQATEA